MDWELGVEFTVNFLLISGSKFHGLSRRGKERLGMAGRGRAWLG